MTNTPSGDKPLNVFISYSHQDAKWKKVLETHLAPLVRGGKLAFWADSRIPKGSSWLAEIKRAMDDADFGVLLVTPAFLESRFITEEEMPALLRKQTVCWIAVKPSNYQATVLADLQCANEPSRALSEMAAPKRDRAWVELCGELVAMADRLKPAARVSAPMDPVAITVLINLVSRTLYSLFGQMRGLARPQDTKSMPDSDQLAAVLQDAIGAAAVGADMGDLDQQGDIRLFLESPECAQAARQICAARIVQPNRSKTIADIRSEFCRSLARAIDRDPEAVRAPAEDLFGVLLGGCHSAVDAVVGFDDLSKLEAKSSDRLVLLHDQLAALDRKIELFAARPDLNVKAAVEFEANYRRQIEIRHGFVSPANFDSRTKVPIDQIYVEPRLSIGSELGPQGETTSTADVLAKAFRFVVLGDPGGGKSTFATKVCHDLASKYDERLLARRLLTPIFVVLRDYAPNKTKLNYSILDHIKSKSKSDYQLEPPDLAFEYLLTSGRVLVVFDGLDELLDTGDRREISSDVECFSGLYPDIPIIVTSRKVGYDQAPLDGARLDTYRLGSFNDDQVRSYVEKWFALNNKDVDGGDGQTVDAFLTESESVPDLRQSPVVLSLLCSIYRGRGYLPRNRPDVFKKCSEMLFEQWDKSRRLLEPSYQFERNIRPAVSHLAHWIYTNPELQSGVSEKLLIHETANYLMESQHDDRDEAIGVAKSFIAFCRGRLWVFSEAGATAREALFQFTHRTFLEYFTAVYLVRKHYEAQALLDILAPKIACEEWDDVSQLAFQLLDENQADGGSRLVEALVRLAETEQDITLANNLLSFATRSLHFMPIARAAIRALVSASIANTLHQVTSIMRDAGAEQIALPPNATRLVQNLSRAALENQSTVCSSLEEHLIRLGSNTHDGADQSNWSLWLAAVIHESGAITNLDRDLFAYGAFRDNLATFVETPRLLPPAARAACGRALSLLGDPRRGVGVKDGLPDIAWCVVPEGDFLYGTDKGKDSGYDHSPQRRIHLPAFRISRYPVTHAQYQVFLDAPDGFANPEWWNGLHAEGLEQQRGGPATAAFPNSNHPRDSISWYESMAFCGWLSRRLGFAVTLPTEEQWEKAARGADGRAYPYGSVFDAAKGNTGESEIGKTSCVGLFPEANLPYWVQDMSGNLWEWMLTEYESETSGDLGSDRPRVLRGGSWLDYSYGARAAFRGLNDPDGRGYVVGFRLVAPAEVTDP